MAEPDVTICAADDGEGCLSRFDRKTGLGLCQKCQLLAKNTTNSGRWQEIKEWAQCMHCGVCARNMAGNCCGRCRDATGVEVNETHRDAEQARQAAMAARMKTVASKTAPIHSHQVAPAPNPLAQTPTTPQLPLTTGAISQARQSASGSKTIGRMITVIMDSNVGGKRDAFLAMNTQEYHEDMALSEILEDNVRSFSMKWEKRFPRSLQMPDCDLRFATGQNPLPETTHLKLGEFYDAHMKSNCHELYFKLPKTLKYTPKTKQLILPLELYIDKNIYLERIDQHSGGTAVGTQAQVGANRKKRSANSVFAVPAVPAKRQKGPGVLQSVYSQASTFKTAAATENFTNISLLMATSRVAQDDGSVDIAWPNSATATQRTAIISDTLFMQGATKYVYKLYFDNDDKKGFVAKRFFTIGGPRAGITPEQNTANLHAELTRLKMGQWWLEKFYEYAHNSGVEVDERLQFATAMLAKEVQVQGGLMNPSPASGVDSIDMIGDDAGVCWLIEDRRSQAMIRHSGTLSHQTFRGKLGQTINAFVHYVYQCSNGNLVIADIQWTEATLSNGKPGIVLFDIMTHTPSGDSGVGDSSQEGIQIFVDQHVCQDICEAFNLSNVHNIDIGGEDHDEPENPDEQDMDLEGEGE